MIITSNKTHTITFPYHDDKGRLKKVKLHPGENEVDGKEWEIVEERHNPLYFKGLKKGEKK